MKFRRWVSGPAAPTPSAGYSFWCPGCDCPHTIQTEPAGWKFDGDLERPTLSPSILVKFHSDSGTDHAQHGAVCHSFVRAGMIEFLSDCTHPLAGQTVAIPEWPANWD